MNRPMPPEHLLNIDPEFQPTEIEPAFEVKKWIEQTFLDKESKLYNPDHEHLSYFDETFLAVLWASSGFAKGGRFVLGQCERVAFRAGGWQKARQEKQMRDWFGFIPTYLITLDAKYSSEASDIDFCALVEHELYHIGVKRDEEGEMLFSDMTGEPKHYLRGHDVEEFFGVVERYGANESVMKMAELANNAPTVSKANIAQACGTCLLKLA